MPASPEPDPSPERSEPAGELDVDEAILAWSALLPDLPVATRGAVQSAQPLRIEGDVLTLCIASEPGGERPTKFAAPRGAKQFLLTLKRRKR